MSDMNTAQQRPGLNDDELGRLDALLAAVDPEESMAVEELDGFFAALACCPEPIPAEEFEPVILGAPVEEASARIDAKDFDRLRKLLARHREAMAEQLYDGEGIAPVLGYDEQNRPSGNAWAIGFVRGMALRPDAWSALDDDEEHAQVLDPLMLLVEEVEPQEDETPEPIPDEEREDAIAAMLDGVQEVYDFFAPARERALSPPTLRRDQPKVGRNDPCPCGSGKKYKQCHGAEH
jgi:uncharacterized protein